MDLTNYAALNVKIIKYSKVNNQFSTGRARVFYEGPNVNRTIFTPEVAKELIKTIPGTPIIGRFNSDTNDFEGHSNEQIAYGFVPLEPNATKVEIMEEFYGLPVKRTYYEVDVVIWDGRFSEAKKVLEEEKSLSMELNPDTLEGEFEIYDDKTFLRITKAEFFGITILGDAFTPCFKDAKFLQTYTSMLSAYESLIKGQESNIGGKNMPNTEEKVIEVEVNETEATITNEEISVEEANTEVESAEEIVLENDSNEEVTPTDEVLDNGTEEISNSEEESVFSENEEASKNEKKKESKCESVEEISENEKKKETKCENIEEASENEKKKRSNCEEMENSLENEEDIEVETEKVLENETNNFESIEALNLEIKELKEKLEVYENAAKEELISKFSSKINDPDFMGEIKDNLDKYSVEDLKSTLGAKLADQILVEETSNEEKNNGMIYSFNGIVKKQTNGGWQDLVRATKATNNK